jgi:hypothetical protein
VKNKAIPKSLRGLKLVKPIKVKAPEIKKSDIPWSEVFEKISVNFKHSTAKYGLCYEIQNAVSYHQAERMKSYIMDLIGVCNYANGWVRNINGHGNVDMHRFRWHWCLHLAKQFRDAGY